VHIQACYIMSPAEVTGRGHRLSTPSHLDEVAESARVLPVDEPSTALKHLLQETDTTVGSCRRATLIGETPLRRHKDTMPVPVSSTNPNGKGLSTHQHTALPSTGGLFSRLGASSATDALEDKKLEQSVDRKDRTATAQQSAANAADAARPLAQTDEPAIVCRGLQFNYTGDDGLPIPGVLTIFTPRVQQRSGGTEVQSRWPTEGGVYARATSAS
jgi:hypothetical protein